MLKRKIATVFVIVSSCFILVIGGISYAANNAVTPPHYDDIGAILTDLGYEFTEISMESFSNYDSIKDFDNLFINCAAACAANATAQATENLRRFVSEGGIIYASDFAFIFIQNSFPGYIDFFDNPYCGYAQICPAEIVDQGLANFLESGTIEIDYNLSAWTPIKDIDTSKVKVYVKGFDQDYGPNDEYIRNKPLLVSFPYGEGAVMYTTFHNEAGLNEETKKLLEYLVLLPMRSNLADALRKYIQERGYIVYQAGQEDKINQDEESSLVSYVVPDDGKVYDLIFGINWDPPGKFKLIIYSPDGSLYSETEIENPPFGVEVLNAGPGEWKYKVKATYVPIDNYLYVTMVGKRTHALKAGWLSKVIVFPNPYIPSEGHPFIAFDNLPEHVTIRIFTSSGELVKTIEKDTDSATELWNVKNQDENCIASGIYVFIINDNAGNTKKGKLAIIR